MEGVISQGQSDTESTDDGEDVEISSSSYAESVVSSDIDEQGCISECSSVHIDVSDVSDDESVDHYHDVDHEENPIEGQAADIQGNQDAGEEEHDEERLNRARNFAHHNPNHVVLVPPPRPEAVQYLENELLNRLLEERPAGEVVVQAPSPDLQDVFMEVRNEMHGDPDNAVSRYQRMWRTIKDRMPQNYVAPDLSHVTADSYYDRVPATPADLDEHFARLAQGRQSLVGERRIKGAVIVCQNRPISRENLIFAPFPDLVTFYLYQSMPQIVHIVRADVPLMYHIEADSPHAALMVTRLLNFVEAEVKRLRLERERELRSRDDFVDLDFDDELQALDRPEGRVLDVLNNVPDEIRDLIPREDIEEALRRPTRAEGEASLMDLDGIVNDPEENYLGTFLDDSACIID